MRMLAQLCIALLVTASVAAHAQDAAPAPPRTIKPSIRGLHAPATATFDAFGVPRIEAESLRDAACLQGWVHARDRFLQMDALRRTSGGDLAALAGEMAISSDIIHRTKRLRECADAALLTLPAAHRELLDAYTAGVNARIAAVPPAEYQLLGVKPRAWRAVDCMLVTLVMVDMLVASEGTERMQSVFRQCYSDRLATFLFDVRGPFEALLLPDAPITTDCTPAALPSADVIDLRLAKEPVKPDVSQGATPDKAPTPGSNAFAVAGTRTKDGRAILGNDMHLMLTAPGIWYRIEMRCPECMLVGVSLPGVPGIVAGTNGKIAWGFTNLTADLADLTRLEPVAGDANAFATPMGIETIIEEETTIEVGRGGKPFTFTARHTSLGPIVGDDSDARTQFIGKDADGVRLALQSIATDPRCIDMRLFDLYTASTVQEAIPIAADWGGAPQNFLVADADGSIGWTVTGRIPLREGGARSKSSLDANARWQHFMPSATKPFIINPPSGILTSANNLPCSHELLPLGCEFDQGDRAYRIRELLRARSDWTEPELLRVQFDARSRRLERWRDAILATLATGDFDAKTIGLLKAWDGTASKDSQAISILDEFRRAFARRLDRPIRQVIAAKLRENGDSALAQRLQQAPGIAIDDEAALRVCEAREPHWMIPEFDSWQSFVAAMLQEAIVHSTKGDGTLWRHGELNQAEISHPLAAGLGPAAALASMPKDEFAGHPTAPLVLTPSFGASERMIVSPKHLHDAILQTPAGQTGLPGSPHFRDLHHAWLTGEAFPLLPQLDGKPAEEIVQAKPK